MKIGLILNNYPKLSEPFIDSFISHIENGNEIYLLANFNENRIKKRVNCLPYLSLNGNQHFSKIYTFIKFIWYLKRFFYLKNKGVGLKMLIADSGIWTLSKLDYLHFPFANLAFGREYYADVLGAKMSISFRGSDLNVYPIYHKLNYENILKKAYKIHCNSIELKEKLLKHQFNEMDKVSIIHSAIREDYKIEQQVLLNLIKQRDFQREIFITTGRLHWVKDYALTFEALGLLKSVGYQFDYKIIGDGPEMEHLMFLADFNNITENVHFLGARNSNEIKAELQKSTMYLQTSLAEGFSNSCLEAQSQGLLCVVTNVSGMSACIENDVTGIILKERSSEQMKDSIMALMNLDRVERRNRELYASERVFSQFSQQIQKQAWINFFSS